MLMMRRERLECGLRFCGLLRLAVGVAVVAVDGFMPDVG